MSLINEALKQARVEAARRDAAAKGVPPAALPVYVPPRRRPWLAPVAGFLAGLAAVAMAAGAFWVARRPPPSAAGETARAAATEAAGASPASPAVDSPVLSPVDRPITSGRRTEVRPAVAARSPDPGGGVSPPSIEPSPVRPPAAVAVPPPATEAPALAPSSSAPPPSAPPAPARPPSAPPAPVPPPSTPAVAEGQTFLRQAAPAGASVKLEFIVWSESRPFAQINGQLLGAGQSIDGYTLLNVERERVELEGGGVRFWLRVR